MESVQAMWALSQTGPSRLEWSEIPAPRFSEIAEGDVVVKTAAGGICGSDLPFFAGHLPDFVPPGIKGFPLHEIAGEVVASRFDGIEVGDSVVGWATGQNGLAEYVVTSGGSVHSFSPDLDPAKAIMLQPLACVLYAVEQIGDVVGKSVAVLGVGPIGALFTHVIKQRGAAHVVGVDRVDRSDVSATFGMDEFAFSDASTWAAGLGAGARPDLVVEAIGHQVETLTAAVSAAAYEGKVFYFGIPNDDVYPLSMTMLLRKNMTLMAGVTALDARRRVLAEAERYLVEHPELVDAYVTSPYPFEHAEAAFLAASRPRSGQMKVTLTASE